MNLSIREEFHLPVSKVYPYFEAPSEWAKLYGVVKPTKILENGWYAVPLKMFPFPLMAKNVELRSRSVVCWIFGGFWRGVGEVTFCEENGRTIVTGFEHITPHGLWILSSAFEKYFMAKEFERIWKFGWQRIRKAEGYETRV